MGTENDGQESTSCLYAWLSRDPEDGIEGVVTVITATGPLPLVCTSRDLADAVADIAHESAIARGHDARLVKFDRGMTLDVRRARSSGRSSKRS